MHKRVSIVGDGSMATVCALLLDGKGVQVTMWGAFAAHIEGLIQTRRNTKYLPATPIPESISLTANDATALQEADLIVSAVPVQFMRPVWTRLAAHTPAGVPIASVSKGIENDTLLRPTQIIADVLGQAVDDPDGSPRPMGAISGPSVAEELSRNLPATVCAASDDEAFCKALQATFTTDWFRVYTNNDMLGVELAGATKNVIALAAGILDGLQAGINAKSALLARGLAEITRLGVAMGARPDTFFGIAGVGDLATTCFSPTGRNRSCGEELGKGRKVDDVLATMKGVVEGVPTTRSVVELAEKHRVEMPITQAVYRVLFDGLDPLEAIGQLMTREAKHERVG